MRCCSLWLSSCDWISSCWCCGAGRLRMTTISHFPLSPMILANSSFVFAADSILALASMIRSPRNNCSPSKPHSTYRPGASGFIATANRPTVTWIACNDRFAPDCSKWNSEFAVWPLVVLIDFSSRDWSARISSTSDSSCNSSRPSAYSSSAWRIRTSILLWKWVERKNIEWIDSLSRLLGCWRLTLKYPICPKPFSDF